MTAKILVVDDEPQLERLILQRFRRKLRNKECEFIFAGNGLEALDTIAANEDVDIVLSDINMPKMDGLTFIGRLKSTKPTIRTVIVSAYGDMQNIRKAMNLGAYDFVTKPIDFKDLEATIDKTMEELDLLRKAALAEELKHKNEQLKEIDRMKARFFANISHEFRTPLTVITGMIEQIEENSDKWLDRGMRMIKRNSSNMLSLVNQILDLAKLESGKLKLKLMQGDIIAYVKVISESFHALAENRNVRFIVNSQIDELIMDYDPEQLLRVISNLLSNSIKFTPPEGKVELQMAKSTDGTQFFISVTDTGIGIPSDRLPHIFDRFYQVPGESLRQEQGTGIGLALSKELVKLMEGDISVESEEGKGTSFHIVLPIQKKSLAIQ
ncbi:MAG: ATP-binding protein [Bacteroidota bacterium]